MKKVTFLLVLVLLFGFNGFSQSSSPENSAINKTDENGLKQGQWEESINRSKVVGNYVDDQRNGTWVFYHPNDIVQTVQTYNMGKKEGLFI